MEAMAAHDADETVRSARAMPDVEECAQHVVQVGARRSAEGGIVRDGADRRDVASYPRCRALGPKQKMPKVRLEEAIEFV